VGSKPSRHTYIYIQQNTRTRLQYVLLEYALTVIKYDLMVLFHDFHQHRIDLSRINYGVITLIPKCDDVTTIQKYRPIFLFHVLFKIFNKALTVRVESVVKNIINVARMISSRTYL
jgi:hypothetical protein